jgi:hypothetical protein
MTKTTQQADMCIDDENGDQWIKREDGVCFQWVNDSDGWYWAVIPSALFNIEVEYLEFGLCRIA